MSFQKKSPAEMKDFGILIVALVLTCAVYIPIVFIASSPASVSDFIWLEPGATKRIFDFYASNLRGSFFTGFLALGGFLMSAKTFIIVNMKKEVYDSASYAETWRDGLKLNGANKYYSHFYPLRRLSNIIFYTITCSFLASIAQLTIGLFSSVSTVMICVFLVITALSFLLRSLFLIKKNLALMFDHLDKPSLKAMEIDRKGSSCN
jgi:hypothetical protein